MGLNFLLKFFIELQISSDWNWEKIKLFSQGTCNFQNLRLKLWLLLIKNTYYQSSYIEYEVISFLIEWIWADSLSSAIFVQIVTFFHPWLYNQNG